MQQRPRTDCVIWACDTVIVARSELGANLALFRRLHCKAILVAIFALAMSDFICSNDLASSISLFARGPRM